MIEIDGWHVERGEFPTSQVEPAPAFLCWQDLASPLRVFRMPGPDGKGYRLLVGMELIVDICASRRIVTRARDPLPTLTVDHVLTDLILPRILSHEGQFVVHAGGVGIDAGALIFLGLSGRGKSTLATSFQRAGSDLLGDDAMIVSLLDAGPLVRAVCPSLRLFPDSIEALVPSTRSGATVNPQTGKCRVALDKCGTTDTPVALRAIFLIGEPNSQGVHVQRLSIAAACMALVENSFALDPSDTDQARRRLDQASVLANLVPAYEISYPRDYARLPEVRRAILAQVAALEPA